MVNEAMKLLAEETKWGLMEYGAAIEYHKKEYEERRVRWQSWVHRTTDPKRKAIYQARADTYTEWLVGIADWPDKIRNAIAELPSEN